MKKMFHIPTVTLFSFFVLHADSLAAPSVQASATARLLSNLRNPIEGTLGLEQSGVRLSASLGNGARLSGALDLLARSRDGLYVGAGLMVGRVDDSFYSITEERDTTTVNRSHDHGKHKGDKHHKSDKHHRGKTHTRITSSTTVVRVVGEDLDLSPALLLGISARRGTFVESRILFSGGDVSNRTSVGLRF